jgi:hypothetical protein
MRDFPNIYFKASDTVGIAFNRKVGSSAIALALFNRLPENEKPTIAFAQDGKEENRAGWQAVAPKIKDPATVLLLVRDPIERFRSACAQIRRTDVDYILTAMEGGDLVNPHFLPQSQLMINTTKLYRFPDDLEALATEAGLSWPLPTINESEGTKPILTEEQTTRLHAVYADDIALYESITEPGQVWTAPPTPEPEPEPLPLITAEDHIARQLAPGKEQFVALRISAFQDLESKLAAAGRASPKLTAMRAWIDGVVGLYATDLQPRNDWPAAPYGFEETVQEAAYVLNQP